VSTTRRKFTPEYRREAARLVIDTGVVFHADRGTQYTSAQLNDVCSGLGIRQSVGRTGVCWDCQSGLVESFWSTLKNLSRHKPPDQPSTICGQSQTALVGSVSAPLQHIPDSRRVEAACPFGVSKPLCLKTLEIQDSWRRSGATKSDHKTPPFIGKLHTSSRSWTRRAVSLSKGFERHCHPDTDSILWGVSNVPPRSLAACRGVGPSP
jgi:transposase InsO family protein